MQQPTGNSAVAGGIILLVCGLAILIGSVTRNWFSQSYGEDSTGIGLYGIKFCDGDECKGMMWSDKEMKGVKGSIKLTGFGSLLLGVASAGVSALFGAMALAGAGRKVPKVLGLIIYPLTMVLMFAFIGSVLGERGKAPDPSWSMGLAFIGLIGALITSLVALPKGGAPQPMMMMQPMQGNPMMMQQPPQVMQGQPCPRCQQPLQFVAQYQRWFCQRCQQYA
jgi:hypothetical protein